MFLDKVLDACGNHCIQTDYIQHRRSVTKALGSIGPQELGDRLFKEKGLQRMHSNRLAGHIWNQKPKESIIRLHFHLH